MPNPIEPSDARAENLRRATHYFLQLARRIEANPDAANPLPKMLGDRVGEYWEPALEAAMKAAERLDECHVPPVIDEVIADSLRKKPDLRLAMELYNRIPLDTVLLKKTSVEVFGQILHAMEERKAAELHPEQYLILLLNYVQRLAQSGRLKEAQSRAEEAVGLARRNYALDREKFSDSLTDSLEAWAMVESALGSEEVSRKARDEVIQLLRAVPGKEAALAQCLNNQSGTLKAFGDIAGALQYSNEAVQLYRSLLAQGDPNAATDYSRGLQAWQEDRRPALADALIALSTHQNDAGNHLACLAAAEEAHEIFRDLSGDYPDQFLQHFGMAAYNLGMAKFGVGDLIGGLEKMQQADRVYANLVNAHKEAYEPTYAHVLGGLAIGYAKNDRNTDAIRAAEACVSMYRKLCGQSSDRFRKQLRTNLENLGFLYEAAGQAELGRGVAEELARLAEV